MASNETGSSAAPGPVIFAYDGSELAKLAIEQAGRQLASDLTALVVCVWQPGDVGFVLLPDDMQINTSQAPEVKAAAEKVAAHGALVAERAGFRSETLAVWASPTWKGLVETSEERNSDLIVLGSHRRAGLKGHLLGSVGSAVVMHAACSVLVIHQRSV